MKVTKFKNGSISVKKEFFYDGEQGGLMRLLELLLNSIELDFIVEGELEPERVGNFGYYYYELKNANNNLYYRIDVNDAIKFDEGKTVKLKGYEL